MTPEIESFAWDEAKSEACAVARGFNFAYAAGVFDDLRSVRVDDRFDYGELRELAFGLVGGRAMAVVFTMRGSVCRIISARFAHEKEVKLWLKSR
jgi:uncharacterized DUF497 family protein